MCWPVRELDHDRDRLQDDFEATREWGKVPRLLRVSAWVGIGVLSFLADLPGLAVPGIVLFEALLAPRVARPRRRELGPLSPWTPPEGMDSPEAPPEWWAGRRDLNG